MRKKKRVFLISTIVLILAVLSSLAWLINTLFEGEQPQIRLQPLPEFFSGTEKLRLSASDHKMGLKSARVSLNQAGREMVVLQKEFPARGLLNQEGTRKFDMEFSIDPSRFRLAQGSVDMEVRVWDHSKRRGGDGNLSVLQHKAIVETLPPTIRAVSRMHYVNQGGAGLVIYQASSDTVESGLFVDTTFFKGFPKEQESQEGLHVCYFAIRQDIEGDPNLYLWAKDKAGNEAKAGFNHRIFRKQFRTEKTNITDGFLKRILPYFSFYDFGTAGSDIEKFLKINRELRQENQLTYYDLKTKTSPEQLWEGTWVRLNNAATMARFGDRRLYYYKGNKVDEQVHLGVDLASLANSEVQAANNGRVIFADRLGIYGLTVVLDHGQGLSSVYSHLSKIGVQIGHDVTKGETIGLTGQTGLAGGDHLHFGIMVDGMFVNPIEWWDGHWIQDNVTRKLALLEE